MRVPLFLILILAAASAAVGFAQAGFSGIRSGFVFDSRDQSIRPVNGMPGAAVVGDAIDFNGLKFDAVEISGTIAYAVASGAYYRLDLATGKASQIQGILKDSALVAPGLFWHAQSRTLQTESRKTFISSDGALSSAALNDSTNCAALAFDAGNVESICGETQTTLLAEPGSRITRLLALGNGFAALDAAQSRILELTTTANYRVLATAADLAQPVGIAKVSNSLLAVANAASQRLTFIPLQANAMQPEAVELRFKPTTLRALTADILQAGEAGPDPFEVIDFAQQGRAFFVPAAASATNAAAAVAVRSEN